MVPPADLGGDAVPANCCAGELPESRMLTEKEAGRYGYGGNGQAAIRTVS